MANPDHLERLRQGVAAWNAWRANKTYIIPDLSGMNLDEILAGTNLNQANLSNAILNRANLGKAIMWSADLSNAILLGANLSRAVLWNANLTNANLSEANLLGADLSNATLSNANLSKASLLVTNLRGADLQHADLSDARLWEANLNETNLRMAVLPRADLSGARLVNADLRDANLARCRIFGISAWRLKLSEKTEQRDLVVTARNEPEITVDNIEVAQFIYLLLHNEKIRSVIDTIGKKGVLLLGCFTDGRIAILERLREELRKRGFLPMVFNFGKPETKNFTETVRLLAGMSRFVIVDITNPRSTPLELQATVPECMVPFVPILDKREELKPFTMLEDLQISHPDRVLDVIRYPSVDRLIEVMDTEIIIPAQERFADLLARKAEGLRFKDI
ncbi:MAG: pentapeptide repeat-containing protein [Acetobacteraceae bacterium]|nr:pentapeptide repeat-containing protein [Acetobacteraceae bacterium]